MTGVIISQRQVRDQNDKLETGGRVAEEVCIIILVIKSIHQLQIMNRRMHSKYNVRVCGVEKVTAGIGTSRAGG